MHIDVLLARLWWQLCGVGVTGGGGLLASVLFAGRSDPSRASTRQDAGLQVAVGQVTTERRAHPSDLSGARWESIEAVLPT